MEAIGQTLFFNRLDCNHWGLSMKGIQPLGRCPKCQGSFKKDSRQGYVCPVCLTHPKRFLIVIHYKGKRIRRATTLEGKTLRSFADAHGLLKQAQNEIDAHKFDPVKWKAKDRTDYRFSYQVDRWYKEKDGLMKEGKRAPSYVPKLFTYIRHYFLPYFGDQDIRDIRTTKDFARQLFDGLYKFKKEHALPVSVKQRKLSLKYQDNILKALRGFFIWLKDDEKLIDNEQMPVFKFEEVPEHKPQIISPETQTMLLDLIPDVHKPIFVFLFYQGCRPSEVRALKWNDINGDVVTYSRTWSGSVLREQTKTKRIRHNLLFEETLRALPPRRFSGDFVFVHGKIKKRHYSPDFLNKIFNTAARKLGLDIELYEATKHSFGFYHLNKMGVSKEMLKEWYGHASVKTTDLYAKIQVVDAFREVQERKNKVVELKSATKQPPQC